ncbi:IS1380 family transposase [Microcoleus sp. herbarium8]
MKITTSLENIKSFGGLNFISTEFEELELPKLITSILGKRSLLATYEYSDAIKNIWMILFSGGDCAEDIQTNLKSELSDVLEMKICSADTLLRLQKELSVAKETHISKNNSTNEFSHNLVLNRLNLAILLLTKQINAGQSYDLDFDNQFIACEKYDSKKGYKMKRGYFPGIATIGKNIVYLENRNGNSNVKFKQEDTLEKVYEMLNTNGVKINRSRMDCGSFTKAVLKVVEPNSKSFYIRAQRCAELTANIKAVEKWKKVTIGSKEFEVASVYYKPFNEDKSYRYVVSREANKTDQIDVFQGDSFIYRAIITNDYEMSDQEVVFFYNQRGSSEKIFDEMNNDFGWGNLPFSFLEQNTVYMLITAMCRNFYLYFLQKIATKITFIENTFRLKKFIFRFVVVPYKWIKKGGQKTLKLFTDKPYNLVLE